MIEKIGPVKNPLTIIAIFAGIAEVSGTVVLPFISAQNQVIFIYFLIVFPSVLILLFFLTLNFNNKALYAPSDFDDQENYIKIFRYDVARQEKVEVLVRQDELLKKLNSDLEVYKNNSNEKILNFESEIKKLFPNEEAEENSNAFFVYIANFPDAKDFEKVILKSGYNTKLYESVNFEKQSFYYGDHESIWLGVNVPLIMAKEVLHLSVKRYPFLKYVQVSFFGPEYIFVGGASEGAVTANLKSLTLNDFEEIQAIQTIEKLHEFLRAFENHR